MSKESDDLWASALAQLDEEDRKSVSAIADQDRLKVLSDLQDLMGKAKDSCIENRWKIRRTGKGGKTETVVLRDLLGKMVVWVDRFKAIGDTVVTYDPSHAALPWAGVRFLLQVVVSDIIEFDFVVEGAEVIARSIARFTIFENLYLARGASHNRLLEDLRDALVRLYTVFLLYIAKGKRYFAMNTAKRALKAIISPQVEFEDIMNKISSEQLNVDRIASLVDTQSRNDISESLHAELRKLLNIIDGPIYRMNSEVQAIRDTFDRSQRNKILRWLSPQPYFDHHQQVKNRVLKGSGQWLLQDPIYAEWHKSSTSSLLWLHGMPGSGKSSIVSIVIEDAMRRFEAVQSPHPIYFYCSRTTAEPERSRPEAIMASLLRQLSCVQVDKSLLPPVIKVYQERGESFTSQSLPLEESQQLIVQLVELYGATTIVVDALDECNPETRQDLLEAFEMILRESCGLVKLFVSSRDDQDIVDVLRDYPSLKISSNKNTADIRAFVETETAALVRKRKLLRNSDAKVEMQALIVDQVHKGADGMFRWATLQLEVLCTLKLDTDIRAKLNKLPPKLEQLYVEIYNELTSYGGDTGRSIIDSVLKLLLCVNTTLRASIFLWAVTINLDNADEEVKIEHVLDLCRNLVIYDEAQDTFRFAHLSVREFLESSAEYSPIYCNLLAGEICFLHLTASSCNSSLILGQSDEKIILVHKKMTATKILDPAGFLTYAQSNCMNHCKLVPRGVRSEDTRFRRLFASFFRDNARPESALDIWVQWHCGRVISSYHAKDALELQDLLIEYPKHSSRTFFVAIHYGFSEVVADSVRSHALGDDEIGKGLLLAAISHQHEVFDLLLDHADWELTEPALFHAVPGSDVDQLNWLLGKASHIVPTERIILAVGKTESVASMNLLLEQYPDIVVNETMLGSALCNSNQGVFQLLLAQAPDEAITGSLLMATVEFDKVENRLESIVHILDKTGDRYLSLELLHKAATGLFRRNGSNHAEVVELLLVRGGFANIPEDFMVNLLRADVSQKIMELLYDHGGQVTSRVLIAGIESQHACTILPTMLERSESVQIDVDLTESVAESDIDGKMLEVLINRGGRITQSTLAAAASSPGDRADVLCVILKHGFEVDRHILRLATSNSQSVEILQVALDHANKFILAEEMPELIFQAANSNHGNKLEKVKVLLSRAREPEISEDSLWAAIRTSKNDIIRIFLKQKKVPKITMELLKFATQSVELDVAVQLLSMVETKNNTLELLEAAAANTRCGEELVKIFLGRGEIKSLPDAVLDNALRNRRKGEQIIRTLEEFLGRIEVTEEIMIKVVRYASKQGEFMSATKYLFDPSLITKKVLMSALSVPFGVINRSEKHPHRVVVENALHIPTTIDVLKAAAKNTNTDCFRFLWIHRDKCSAIAKPPTDLLIEAAKGRGKYTFDFLLDRSEANEIRDENLLVLIIKNGYFRVSCHKISAQLHVSERILEVAIAETYYGPGYDELVSLLLQHFHKKEVTENMFRAAAHAGNSYMIFKLSEYSDLESPPLKWLEMSQLYKAAALREIGTMKLLVDRGVKLDIVQEEIPYRLALIVLRDDLLTLEMLLSAGLSPDALLYGEPLLWEPAKLGHLEKVKVLVNAGASLHWRNEDGYTAEMIAIRGGHIRTFRFLKQARISREKSSEPSATATC